MTGGNHAAAIENFSRVIELKPDSILSHYRRGQAYFQSGSYDDAIADFSKAIELMPDFSDVYYYRALAYLAKGDNVRAATELASCFKFIRVPG